MEISERDLKDLEELVKARKTRYVPKIAKADLEDGEYYLGKCRNATVARWNKAEEIFYHWRSKFSCMFIENIRCPEDESTYDVFVTERKLTPEERAETREVPFD